MFTEKYAVVKKMFTSGLNISLSRRVWVEKTVHRMEAQNKKVPDAAASKQGHADSLLEHKRTHQEWFP